MMSTRLALLPCLALAGCAMAPLSYLVGTPESGPVDVRLYAVRVLAVDATSYLSVPAQGVQVLPGARSLLLAAEPGQGARRVVQKRFVLKVEPCTRYVLAARRQSPLEADWELVVQSVTAVASCDPAEELKKAAAG